MRFGWKCRFLRLKCSFWNQQNYPWANPLFIASETCGKMNTFVGIKWNNFSIQISMVPPVSETMKICRNWTFYSFSLDYFLLSRQKCLLARSVKRRRILWAQELLHFGELDLPQPRQRWWFHAIITPHATRAWAPSPGAEQQTHHALFSKTFSANVKFWPSHFIKRIIS